MSKAIKTSVRGTSTTGARGTSTTGARGTSTTGARGTKRRRDSDEESELKKKRIRNKDHFVVFGWIQNSHFFVS